MDKIPTWDQCHICKDDCGNLFYGDEIGKVCIICYGKIDFEY